MQCLAVLPVSAAQTGLDMPTARPWPVYRSRYHNILAGHASCHGSWRGTVELGMQGRTHVAG